MSHRETDSGLLWSSKRRLHNLYVAMAREFVLEAPACPELEQGFDVPSQECESAGESWFATMDQKIQIHHLRQFAQNSALMDEEALRDFIAHHLMKKERTAQDRDKLDFLMVQFFSKTAPLSASDPDPSLEFVAEALEPVLGKFEIATPEFVIRIDELLREALNMQSVKAMFTARIIERGREIKTTCGDSFFDPIPLATFTRFGFLIRRRFFRLMHDDLNSIFDGLRELESRGVTTLDCRKAQFAADEPVGRLRLICQSWRVMFQAEYSSGQPLALLVDLRTAVEAALNQSVQENPKAMAATVGGSSSGADLEFEVSVLPPDPESEQ